jgi:hypothetical protein
MNSLSHAPFGTTLVSPVTICTPAVLDASAIERATLRKSSTFTPSSTITGHDKYSGMAPPTTRSLTVPKTASRPMSPPGKNRGSTTNASVAKAKRSPCEASVERSTRAWSSSGAKNSLSNAATKTSSISVLMALPPPPWASVTVGTLSLPSARGRRSPGLLMPHPNGGRGGRIGSRPHTPLRRTP